MKQRVPVSSIMASDIVKLNITDSLTYAEGLFKKHKIRHLPVVSGNKLVGILSYTDLLKISLAETVGENDEIIDMTVYNMFTIEQVMVKDVITIQADENVREAAEILVDKDFRSLPVMEGDMLVGILTTTDLIKYLLKQYV
ncbi:CBS domain-containing protein [Myroides phaeus]|uniref:CBS domain-containing protein n=1 Tax=Myroides phaeus TaxID=702745 RepID=A0A1G8BGH5_9FLAO|nr:CBS domain-containing protein [Myroides phaeus]MEC4116958.1 CBS domain-containing protein [Myroides phaeus]SDH32268.1 CBS domain-containing protein [Myroides phaeus]